MLICTPTRSGSPELGIHGNFVDESFMRVIQPTTVPCKVRNCTIAQCHQPICTVLSHFHALPTFQIYGIYTWQSPFNVRNDSLFVCLHGCADACASCATKQTFAQCRIFLEGTLQPTLPTHAAELAQGTGGIHLGYDVKRSVQMIDGACCRPRWLAGVFATSRPIHNPSFTMLVLF